MLKKIVLLSRSSQIKVLQPQWPDDKVQQMLENTIHRYDERRLSQNLDITLTATT